MIFAPFGKILVLANAFLFNFKMNFCTIIWQDLGLGECVFFYSISNSKSSEKSILQLLARSRFWRNAFFLFNFKLKINFAAFGKILVLANAFLLFNF